MNMMDVKSISVRVDGTEIQARAGKLHNFRYFK